MLDSLKVTVNSEFVGGKADACEISQWGILCHTFVILYFRCSFTSPHQWYKMKEIATTTQFLFRCDGCHYQAALNVLFMFAVT